MLFMVIERFRNHDAKAVDECQNQTFASLSDKPAFKL
jgi:hypothetical protein